MINAFANINIVCLFYLVLWILFSESVFFSVLLPYLLKELMHVTTSDCEIICHLIFWEYKYYFKKLHSKYQYILKQLNFEFCVIQNIDQYIAEIYQVYSNATVSVINTMYIYFH